MERRKPLRRRKQLRRHKPLEPSKVRLQRHKELRRSRIKYRPPRHQAEWEAARDAHLRAVDYQCELGPILEAAGKGPWRQCRGDAFTCHHVKARGMGGSRDHSLLAAACSICHDWIEAHPHIAEQLGLKVRHG